MQNYFFALSLNKIHYQKWMTDENAFCNLRDENLSFQQTLGGKGGK